MKLELKHLAPYLPYGLKGIEYGNNVIHTLESIRYLKDFHYPIVWRNDSDVTRSRIDCKPLLRPLPDLTKEIEHNGEKFVPMIKLFEIEFGHGLPYELHASRPEVITNFTSATYKGAKYKTLSFIDGNFSYSVLNGHLTIIGHFTVKHQLELFNKLFEWHFDVFNGIGTWAIDINTLTNTK